MGAQMLLLAPISPSEVRQQSGQDPSTLMLLQLLPSSSTKLSKDNLSLPSLSLLNNSLPNLSLLNLSLPSLSFLSLSLPSLSLLSLSLPSLSLPSLSNFHNFRARNF